MIEYNKNVYTTDKDYVSCQTGKWQAGKMNDHQPVAGPGHRMTVTQLAADSIGPKDMPRSVSTKEIAPTKSVSWIYEAKPQQVAGADNTTYRGQQREQLLPQRLSNLDSSSQVHSL